MLFQKGNVEDPQKGTSYFTTGLSHFLWVNVDDFLENEIRNKQLASFLHLFLFGFYFVLYFQNDYKYIQFINDYKRLIDWGTGMRGNVYAVIK